MVSETTNPVAKLDGYELRHLVSHLELANRGDDLYRLLCLETTEATNAWYEAKEAAGDLNGYLVDVNQAWRIAERAYSVDRRLETGANIGRQFRYALIIASLNSLASNVPPGLLSAAVEEGLSTPEQAFASIRGLPNEALLAASLAELAPHLAETALLQQATATARKITYEPSRDQALSALALQWARQQQAGEASAIIKEISEEANLSQLIAGLAPLLPADSLPELLPVIAQMRKSESQAMAYSALAPHLPAADQDKLLKAIQKIRSQRLKTLTFLSTLDYLPEPQRSQVLARSLKSTNSLRNPVTRAELTATLLPYLPDDQRNKTLKAFIRDNRKVKDRDKRGAAWGEVVPFLPESDQNRAFSDVLAIKNKRIRAEALEKFAPILSQDRDKRAAVDAAKQIDVREYLVRTMAAILPCLSGRLRQGARSSAWKAAQEIKNAYTRGQAFGLLAPYLTEAMWQQTMEILGRLRSVEGRVYLIQGIADHLPGAMVEQALAIVDRIPPGPERAAALAALTPRLSAEDLLPQAMTTAREIADTDAQLEALVALAPSLATAGGYIEALEIVEKINEADIRALALAELAPRLSSIERRRARESMVAAVHKIKDSSRRARTIEQLASNFPREMLGAALAISSEADQAYGLLALIPHLPAESRQRAQEKALAAVRFIMRELEQAQSGASQLAMQRGPTWRSWMVEDDLPEITGLDPEMFFFFEHEHYWREWHKRELTQALAQLIPGLAGAGFVAEAKEAAAAVAANEPGYSRDVYAGLIPFLDEPERRQTIQRYLIDERSWDRGRIILLAEIAPDMLVAYRENALESLQAIGQSPYDFIWGSNNQLLWSFGVGEDKIVTAAQAWAALARCQPEPDRKQILAQGIEWAQKSGEGYFRERLLAALSPYIAELGYPETAMRTAGSIFGPAERAQALAGMAPHLPPELMGEALDLAGQIVPPSVRYQALAPLALRMSQLPFDVALYPLWREILTLLSRGTRRDLLGQVADLAPVMVALCDSDQIVRDVVHSITRVGRSWP